MCMYCDHNREECGARSSENSFVCTRQAGHNGNHIACGGTKHIIEVWPNKRNKLNCQGLSLNSKVGKLNLENKE